MITISRRTFGRRAGSAIAMSQAGLLASTALKPVRASGLTLAKAVEFGAGNVLYQDAKSIFSGAVSQLTTQSLFMNMSLQQTAFMPATYPGQMTLVSLTDALGHPRLQVNMLPPSVMIHGSSGNNPSLQVLGALDTTEKDFFSYVIPDFKLQVGNLSDWETLQIKIGILPTTPARWIVEAVDFNQQTAQLRAGMGYWTNITGTIPNHDQTNPVAFNIPLQNSGLAGDTRGMVFSIGAPMTSAAGGYKLVGGANAHYEQLYAKVANLVVDFNPGNFSLADTLPHFINLNGTTSINKMTTAISQAEVKVSTAYEVANAIYNQAQYNALSEATQAATDAVSAVTTALASISNEANQATAHADTVYAQTQSIQAQQLLKAAGLQFTLNNNEVAAAQNTLSAMQQLVAAMDSLGSALTAAYPPVPASVPSVVPAPSAYSTIFPATPGPAVDLSGNATTTVNYLGQTVPASSNSFSYNQVNGVDGSLTSGTGQAPGQPVDDGTGVTIESITITGM